MTRIVIFTIFINALGNYFFSRWLGLAGISLSTSVVYAISAVAVFIYLSREIKEKLS